MPIRFLKKFCLHYRKYFILDSGNILESRPTLPFKEYKLTASFLTIFPIQRNSTSNINIAKKKHTLIDILISIIIKEHLFRNNQKMLWFQSNVCIRSRANSKNEYDYETWERFHEWTQSQSQSQSVMAKRNCWQIRLHITSALSDLFSGKTAHSN